MSKQKVVSPSFGKYWFPYCSPLLNKNWRMYFMLLFLDGIVYHRRSNQWPQFHMASFHWRKKKTQAKCQCNHKKNIIVFISIYFKFFDKSSGRPFTTLNSVIWPDLIKISIVMSRKEEADCIMSKAKVRNWACL